MLDETKTPISFKKAAVLLVTEQGYGITQAAEAVGTSVKNLQRWKQQYTQTGRVNGVLNAEERTELLRLRRENHPLRMEQDLLKKASAFFAREMK
jgi:transposase